MNPRTVENLTEIFGLLAQARTKARRHLKECEDCDLYTRGNRQKYLAISHIIGDLQAFVVSQMKPPALTLWLVILLSGCSTPDPQSGVHYLPHRLHRQALEELHRQQ